MPRVIEKIERVVEGNKLLYEQSGKGWQTNEEDLPRGTTKLSRGKSFYLKSPS